MEITSETISKIKSNDRKVILDLYHYVFNVLMSNAVRYKNNQEDQMTIVNNSFLKIVQNIEKFKIGTAFLSWSKQIVRNEIIDNFRKEKNYKELFDQETDETTKEDEVIAEIDYQIEEEALQSMLGKLPPATNVVFNLYAIEGYSYKEIGEKLDISKETVKWHLKSARKKLKAMLQETLAY